MTEENKEITGSSEPNSEATPATETATPDATQEQTQTTDQSETADKDSQTTTEEEWEYNGDRKAVPDPFKKYAAGFDRYVSKKDQAIVEARKQAEEYKRKLEELQSAKPSTETTGSTELPQITKDEADAIALGDVDTMQKVFDREINRRLQSREEIYKKEFQSISAKQQEQEASAMVESFGKLNPGFNEALEDDAIYDYIVNAVHKGYSLDQAWSNVKRIEERGGKSLQEQKRKELEDKKAGIVAGKSIAGNADIVYAENEEEAKRLSIELAMKGDKRQVAVKRK